MIIGIGIDIVQLARIQKLYERYGQKFLRHILSKNELSILPLKIVPYAGSRFAAKEAAVKALGTGFTDGITPACIEILNDCSGKPYIEFKGKALHKAECLGVKNILLSISHEQEYAVAMAVMEN